MKTAIIIVLALLVVGTGAYFAGKNGLIISFNKPETSAFPSPTLEPGLEPEPVPPSPSASPDEGAVIIAGIKAGLIAEHGQSAANMTVTVGQIVGDYATGMANDQYGGGVWFGAKVGAVWKLVWDGNGIIQCTDLTNYPNFPKDLIPSCWDTSTDKLINR